MADEIVGRLGAEIFLDDSGVQASAQRIDVSFREAAAGMSQLTNASVGVSRGMEFIDISTGRTISTFEALKSISVTTEGELRKQIAALDLLISKTQDDVVATAQLVQRQQGLQRALQGTTGKMTGSTTTALDAQQAITGLTRAVQGGTRSFTGAIPGLLSFQRNVQAVQIRSAQAGTSIKGTLISALKGGGGLALALTAAGIAMELFGEATADATDDVEDLFSALSTLPTVGKVGFDESTLRRAIDNQQSLIDGLEQQVKAGKEAAKEEGARLRLGQAYSEEVISLQNARREELELNKDIKKQLEEGLKTYRAQVGFQDRLLNAGGEDLEQKRATEKAQTKIAREAEKAARAGDRSAKAAARQLATQNRFIDKFAASVAIEVDEKAAEKTIKDVLSRIAAKRAKFTEAAKLGFDTGLEFTFEEDLFGEFGAEAIRIDRALKAGLLPTMEALELRSDTLRSHLMLMSDAGEHNTAMFADLKQELGSVDAALAAIDIAGQFIEPFADGMAGILLQMEKGNDLLDQMKQALRSVVAGLIQAGLTRLVGGIIGTLAGGPAGAALGSGAASQIFDGAQIFGGGSRLSGGAVSLGTIENRIEGTTLVQVIELTRQIGSA